MFESFRKFLPEVSEGRRHPAHFEHNDYRLAAAALLVHTAAIDGNMSDLERDKLHAVVKRQFGLDEATTGELVAEATEAEHEAIDLYHFTSSGSKSPACPAYSIWKAALANGARSGRTQQSGHSKAEIAPLPSKYERPPPMSPRPIVCCSTRA